MNRIIRFLFIRDTPSLELNILSRPELRDEITTRLKEQILIENFEIEVRNKNGNPVWLSATYKIVEIDRTLCIFSVSTDITERKKAEEQLKLVNKDLESFSYSVSHDLNAPLRVIKGIAVILSKKYASVLDAYGTGMLELIRNNAGRMGELITALLEFSRLGLKELVTSEINMTDLVIQVKTEAEKNDPTAEKAFIINDLINIRGDMVLIRQVWVNLISNAIKYSKNIPNRKIEIGSFYKEQQVVYYVKDNGAGFDMINYDQLFGVFKRLHTQEEFEGTGIGLANVKKIIQHHGGNIWATSKLQEGACFYFSLPVEEGDSPVI